MPSNVFNALEHRRTARKTSDQSLGDRGTVMLATFMEVLDTSVANVALPHIAGSLSSSVDESTWVLTAYLVANAIVLPLSGWFSTLFGRKRFYMTCVLLFTRQFGDVRIWRRAWRMLILFRVLQGLGGGALQPVSQAILRETFPTRKTRHGDGGVRHGRGVSRPWSGQRSADGSPTTTPGAGFF